MKKTVMICSFLLIAFSLFAGDTARFVNLGFSADGANFMFAQHGFQADSGRLYSDLYIVDVKRNVFVSGGVHHGEYESIIEPGQSSDGALYSLLETTAEQRKRYNIAYLEKGRPLYIRFPETEEENSNNLNFRDFERGSEYTVDLVQEVEGEGNALQSRFYIDLKIVQRNGIVKNLKIGHPDYSRKGITEYNINRILLSPGEDSLVFIISKSDIDLNVRYMIETVKIN
ncbi:MAG: DUF2259 domain-containing protein [Spirochaetales bacterium]|nr:DUF2259 domain-containing protein [Spirochaetales bacterium]